MKKEMIICRYKHSDVLLKFTYTEGEAKPYHIYINDISIRCDEKSFGSLIDIVISNVE